MSDFRDTDLISNKDAMIALNNGEKVEFSVCGSEWDNALNVNIGVFLNPKKFSDFKFRLKPQTITINSIEVPKPFEPKIGDYVYFVSSDETKGYAETTLEDTPMNWGFVQFGVWRTESEIKQVVEALRSIFKQKKEGNNV